MRMDTVREEVDGGFRAYVKGEAEAPSQLAEGEAASDVVMGSSDSEHALPEGHSSEEELEEIITNKRPVVYTELRGDNKRKWVELSRSGSSGESEEEGWEEPELRPHQSEEGVLLPSQVRHTATTHYTASVSLCHPASAQRYQSC